MEFCGKNFVTLVVPGLTWTKFELWATEFELCWTAATVAGTAWRTGNASSTFEFRELTVRSDAPFPGTESCWFGVRGGTSKIEPKDFPSRFSVSEKNGLIFSQLWPAHRYRKSQNRLLKVCCVPATSTRLPRVSSSFSFLFLLQWPLTVLIKQTRQAVCKIKQYIYILRCLWLPCCHVAMLPCCHHRYQKSQNRLLKVCCVPATSAGLPRVSFSFSFLFLLQWPFTVLIKQTR